MAVLPCDLSLLQIKFPGVTVPPGVVSICNSARSGLTVAQFTPAPLNVNFSRNRVIADAISLDMAILEKEGSNLT